MRFSTLPILALAAGMVLLAGSALSQKNSAPEAMLRAAMDSETVDGDLKAAVEQYKKVIAQKGASKDVVAKALMRLGGVYQKQGSAEARKAYERVVRDFADQKEVAADAGRRLTALNSLAVSDTPSPRILASPSQNDQESISVDGRSMAVIRWPSLADNELAIQDMFTGKLKRLLVGRCGNPCTYADQPLLSPDSRQVAYTWSDEGEIEGQGQLRVIANETGARPRVLVRNPEFDIWAEAWSPDAKSIVVSIRRKDDGTWQWGWVSAADGSLKILKSIGWRHVPGGGGISLSPDGRYIAYSALATNPSKATPAAADPTDAHIYTLAADGSGESEVIKTAAVNRFPVWAPDGAHIVYTSNLSGKSDLWSVAVQNGKAAGSPAMIRRDVGAIYPVGMTRFGSYYYDQRKTGVEQVSIAELMPGGGSRVVESLVGINPTWSTDGKSLAFSRHSARGDNNDLVLRSVETGEEKVYAQNKIPNAPAGLRGTWLHNGTGLLQCVRDSQTSGPWSLYFIDKKSGEFKNALQPAANMGNCPSLFFALSPDDRTIYFADRTNPDFFDRIISVALAGGQPKTVFMLPGTAETLPRNGGEIGIALSPDGRTFAVMTINHKTRQGHLSLVLIGSGDVQEIYTSTLPANPTGKVAWTKDGRAILFATHSEGSGGTWQIMGIGIGGGKPEFTGLTIKGLSTFDLSPDGSRVAFSAAAGSLTQDLLAIDNLPALFKDSK